jgi:hypothetical protein
MKDYVVFNLIKYMNITNQEAKRVLPDWTFQANNTQTERPAKTESVPCWKRMLFLLSIPPFHPEPLSSLLLKLAASLYPLVIAESRYPSPRNTLTNQKRFAIWLASLASPLPIQECQAVEFEKLRLELIQLRKKFGGETYQIQDRVSCGEIRK